MSVNCHYIVRGEKEDLVEFKNKCATGSFCQVDQIDKNTLDVYIDDDSNPLDDLEGDEWDRVYNMTRSEFHYYVYEQNYQILLRDFPKLKFFRWWDNPITWPTRLS